MNNDGHVYSVFTMWPLLRRVYQAWAGTLCPQSVLEKARQSETVDGFNLINAAPDESETHRLGKHKKTAKFGKHSGWV